MATPEELKEMLEKAARAMGLIITHDMWRQYGHSGLVLERRGMASEKVWNPYTSSSDCAEMNAALCLHTTWATGLKRVEVGDAQQLEVEYYRDNTTESKLAAWRLASLRVAALVGEGK